MKKNQVIIRWIQKHDKECLHIIIKDYFDQLTAFEAVAKWKEEMASRLGPNEKANIICNCLEMKGYDTEARKLWQQTLSLLKSQINCMWIITDNRMFILAANTMGLLSKFQIKTAKSESEACLYSLT